MLLSSLYLQKKIEKEPESNEMQGAGKKFENPYREMKCRGKKKHQQSRSQSFCRVHYHTTGMKLLRYDRFYMKKKPQEKRD